MKFTELPLPGAWLIELEPIADQRGWFARTFCERTFAARNLESRFPQMNHSSSVQAGIIRGLHYQLPPAGEVKLFRCIRGEVYDVIVDVRANSPTFLQWHGTMLSQSDQKMIYVPVGFAHGYQAMTDAAEVSYQSSAEYSPEHERCIRFDDAKIGIAWPNSNFVVSRKDATTARLPDDFQGVEVE